MNLYVHKTERDPHEELVASQRADRRDFISLIGGVAEIETLAKSDSSCRRVMTVPGIGPIISSAMVAAIGSGAAFARGRPNYHFRLATRG